MSSARKSSKKTTLGTFTSKSSSKKINEKLVPSRLENDASCNA